MAFISDGVGNGARNLSQDVQIIQWLLIRAQNYYGLRLFSKQYKIPEDGIANTVLFEAIRDIVIIYPNKNLTKAIDSSSLVYDISTSRKPIIFPDDISYNFLLSCSIKPVCTICVDNIFVKVDFYDDPLVRQAMGGRINFQTFKHAVEIKDGIMECQTLTKEGIEAKEKLKDPRVRAFLDMLAVVEGTDVTNDGIQNGYDVVGGTATRPTQITDLAKHPGSVATGRYQAIPDTWNEAKTALGLTDFTPESQDIFGAWKLVNRTIINDIVNDQIAEAIDKGSLEWASLPNRAATATNGGVPTSYHKYSRGARKEQPQPVPKNAIELEGIYNAALRIYRNKK